MQVRRPGGVVVGYKYDALGRRIEQSGGGGWLRFSYDGADVVVDRAGYGAQTLVTTEYTNGLGVDEKLSQRMSSALGSLTLYYVADHQGSTRALVNAAGNVVERQQYDAFGNSTGSLLSRYGYTGRERDALTGLYYYRARWYDSQLGRFISEDPIGFAGGVNWYAYVSNNPVNFIDPLGLQDRAAPRGTPAPLGPFPTPGEYQKIGDEFLRQLDALDKLTDWDWIRRARQGLGTDPTPADFVPPIAVPPLVSLTSPIACDPNIYNANDRRKIRKIARDTGLTPDQVGDAIHKAKRDLFGDTNPDLEVNKNGDMHLPGSGDFVGNIRDFVTGNTGQRGPRHGRGGR